MQARDLIDAQTHVHLFKFRRTLVNTVQKACKKTASYVLINNVLFPEVYLWILEYILPNRVQRWAGYFSLGTDNEGNNSFSILNN